MLVSFALALFLPYDDTALAQATRRQPDPKDVFDCTDHGIRIVKPSGEQWQFATKDDLKDLNRPDAIPTPCHLRKTHTAEDPVQVDLYVRIMEHTKRTRIREKTRSGKEIEKDLMFSNVKGVAQWIERELRERDYKDIKEFVKTENKRFRGARKPGIEFSFKAKAISGGYPAYCRQVFIADNGRTYQLDLRVTIVSSDAAKEGKDFTWNEQLKKDIEFIFNSFLIYKVKPPKPDD